MKKSSDTWFLASAGILFGVFLLDIFLGKAALELDMEPIISVGDVGEFLLLLAAVICFVVVVLHREYEETIVKTQSADAAEEDI